MSPYFGFVQWQVYYSHPAAEFEDRIAFLRELAASGTPQILRGAQRTTSTTGSTRSSCSHGPNLSFDFRDDNFPSGTKGGTVMFARSLFDPGTFDLVDLGAYVVAVRR